MSDQQKNEEGQEEIKVSSSENENNNQQQEGEPSESKTLKEITSSEVQEKKIKNLTSALILLLGVVIGCVFIDVVQFLSQSGYSQRALKDAEIFEMGDKTWVSYDDPTLEVKVLGVSDEELENCESCDPTEFLLQMKKFIPTMIAKKVEASSKEGQELIEKYNLKTIPAFVFNNDVKDTEFYSQAGVESIFDEEDGKYVLNTNALGVPVGKYLELPEVNIENYSVLGNKDAKVQMVIYSDYQCPYSKMFYDVVKEVVSANSDKVAMIYKDLPLDFHPQANNASMAAACAQEQGKFWEMTDSLYENQEEWSEEETTDIFKSYAKSIGLDSTKFDECLDSNKYQEKIDADMAEAGNFGISGTPSGFVGEQFIGGVAQAEALQEMINTELGLSSKEDDAKEEMESEEVQIEVEQE